MNRRLVCGWCFVFCTFLAVGCSGGDPGKVKIKGKISLDGASLARGTMSATRTDGTGQTGGGIIKDGNYEAEVPTGEVLFKVFSPKTVTKKKAYPAPDSPFMEVLEGELLPPQFNTNSTLKRDIKASDTDVDFELSSKAK